MFFHNINFKFFFMNNCRNMLYSQCSYSLENRVKNITLSYAVLFKTKSLLNPFIYQTHEAK